MPPGDALNLLHLDNWRDLRTQLVWAYDGRVSPSSLDMEYNGAQIPAWLIRRGSVTLRFPSGEETISAGHWVFPRAVTGWQVFSSDTEILSVRFVAEWPTGHTLFDRSQTVIVPAANASFLTRAGERLAQLVKKRFADAGAGLPVTGVPVSPELYFDVERLLYGWLHAYHTTLKSAGLLPRTTSKLDDRIRRAMHFLDLQPLSQPLREKQLAQTIGLSKSQLSRLFLGNIGCTPTDYFEQKRVESARLSIIEGGQSIKSLAFDLGFSSLPHFSSWVRKKLGASPRALRNAPPVDRTT